MGSASLGTSCQSASMGAFTMPLLALRATQALAAGSNEAARLLPMLSRDSTPAALTITHTTAELHFSQIGCWIATYGTIPGLRDDRADMKKEG